ncbi:MAG: hypothetical protein NDI61_12615 [Bdellovibrionaceae bacterium]|nr:hypothetical protein [Pseudobdellovibrionaceae bacterium]
MQNTFLRISTIYFAASVFSAAATTFAAPETPATPSGIDADLCAAGLPGFSAFVSMETDGRLTVEGSRFYEKRDTSDPLTKKFHFRTQNKKWDQKSDPNQHSHPMIVSRLLTDQESRDALTITRDTEGRITHVAADSLDKEIKTGALLLTESGWIPAPVAHTVGFRYAGKRCLKTLHAETGANGELHLRYSEPHCEALFPVIEALETGRGEPDPRRLLAIFSKLERDDEAHAKRARLPIPHLGGSPPTDGKTTFKISTTERAARFAQSCLRERGGLEQWQRLRNAEREAERSAAPPPASAGPRGSRAD